MTHEIGAIDENIDGLDTRGLELLEAEDAAQARLKTAREKLANLGKDHASERQRIEGQVVEKKAKVDALQRERKRADRGPARPLG